MLPFIAWYLTITAAGWIAFPLAYRLMRFLPDRGYTMSRALGWLVWGYVFWLGTSLGITSNNPGGILLALAVLAAASLAVLGGKRGLAEIREWMRKERRLVISAEVVFLAAFGLWALVRAFLPDINGTEKPMELAFVNGILASDQFPPHDPWLSGYAISYYYFGYVLVAMLARITATASGVAFNLGIALLFGMTAVGAYGLVHNLLRSRRPVGEKPSTGGLYSLPLLGPLFLLLVSNIEGFLEILHARGLFWTRNFDGTWTSGFWKWLGILELNQPPAVPFSWITNRSDRVVWWRASRVLADYGYNGSFREIIDEFPFFSYLLGDMHPHVLAMPFALLAAGLALNLFLNPRPDGFKIWRLSIPIPPAYFLLSVVVLGGMSFLNTWDFPIYIALFSGAFILGQARQDGWRWSLAGDFIKLGLMLGIAGGLLYLPFYTGFSSQAGGILPSVIFFTTGTQFWIMFAPLIVPLIIWLAYSLRSPRAEFSLGKGLQLAGLITGGLWVGSYLFAGLSMLSDRLGSMFLANQGMASLQLGPLITQATLNRLKAPGAWITLLILLGLALAAVMARPKRVITFSAGVAEDLDDQDAVSLPGQVSESGKGGHFPAWLHENGFVLLLILLGVMLTLVPEFFYLLDQFGGRMNTIFKFYFQAWLVWSIAAAYATAVLLLDLRRTPGMVFRIGMIVLLFMGLVYAPVMLVNRTNGFQPPADGLTLDGLATFRTYNPDEAAGIAFLRSAPPGVVAEAVGGQYSAYARVATQSGLSTVIGWPGHESQWRGSDEAFKFRGSDIERLYVTNDWTEADSLIRQYGIRYIFVGSLERNSYRVNEKKFQDNLAVVFQQGGVTIYEAPENQPVVSQTGLGQ